MNRRFGFLIRQTLIAARFICLSAILHEEQKTYPQIDLSLSEVRCVAEEERQPAILYQCLKCGATVKSTELELGIRCPYCRYRVLKKIRPPIVKRIKAE